MHHRHRRERRQEAASARARYGREIERLGIELEAQTASLREAEKRLESLREEHYRAGDAMHTAQGALYESNAAVARLEQEIAHIRENRQRIEHQIANLRAQLEHGESQLQAAREKLGQAQEQSGDAEAALATHEAALSEEAAKLPVAEEAYRTSHKRRDELQRSLAQTEQALHVERTKVEHAERVLEQLARREERLHEEQAALAKPDEAALERLRAELTELEGALEQHRSRLSEKEDALPDLEQRLRASMDALDLGNQRVTGIDARLTALTQLQDAIGRGAGLQDWLASKGLDAAPRIWQSVSIDAGWEDALESVLRERLNGIALPDLEVVPGWLAESPPGKLTVVESADANGAPTPDIAGLQPLERYVTCRDVRLEPVLREWLRDVFVLPDDASGLAVRQALPAGGMLVDRHGHVYTRHSVSFHAPDSELHGVLTRQREIETLQAEAAEARAAVPALASDVESVGSDIAEHKRALAQIRENLGDAQERHHAVQIEVLRVSEEAQRLTQRGERIALELSEIAEHVQTERAHREEASTNEQRLVGESTELRVQLDLATELYSRADAVLTRQREALSKAQHAHQDAMYQARTAQARIQEFENAIRIVGEQNEALATTLANEEEALQHCDEAPWQTQLQEALSLRTDREQALAQARDALEGFETRLKEIEQERLAIEQRLGPIRDRMNDVRLKEQEARLTEEQYAQQLAESGADEEALRAVLEKGTRSGALQTEIGRLNEEIKALGAVNLAALEELQSAQERKTYLDAQSQDLNEAMTTLEDAIRRIDRETRERLLSTFEEVNGHFSRMFPALFGGGSAKLVLTGEEILDSGIQVIAQPPGKKNASIHLLSGGEKALTALSLVFSIFQLNPAPFCLLDEVDAPLDDHNTGRFCDLVRQMSSTSQFLFISHNKITMEIANQLLGITMQEPGVSRVVAVDIEEAMKLTEEAAA
jgi:chromosome segregation protein